MKFIPVVFLVSVILNVEIIKSVSYIFSAKKTSLGGREAIFIITLIPISYFFAFSYLNELTVIYIMSMLLLFWNLFAVSYKFYDKQLIPSVYSLLLIISAESFIKNYLYQITVHTFGGCNRQRFSIIASVLIQLPSAILLRQLSRKHLWDIHEILQKISSSTYAMIICYVVSLELYTSLLFLKTDISYTKIIVLQITAFITLIIMMVMILLFVVKDITKKNAEKDAQLLEEHIKKQIEHYSALIQIISDFRSFRHDYKSHLHCIRSLIAAENYDDVKKYLDKLTETFNPQTAFIDSGNKIADAILTDKMCYARQNRIDFKFEGQFFETIPMVDICIILSNILDNAIEACLKISDRRWISVIAVREKGIQYIEVSNSKSPVLSENIDTTSKSDKTYHGLGLGNIRRTAGKYNGIVEINNGNDKFCITVILNV